MQRSNLFAAAFAVSTLVGVFTGTSALAAQPSDGDYVLRPVRSSNPKDVFVHVVRVPRATAHRTDLAAEAQPGQKAGAVRYRVGPPPSNPKDYFRPPIAVRD